MDFSSFFIDFADVNIVVSRSGRISRGNEVVAHMLVVSLLLMFHLVSVSHS